MLGKKTYIISYASTRREPMDKFDIIQINQYLKKKQQIIYIKLINYTIIYLIYILYKFIILILLINKIFIYNIFYLSIYIC